MKSLLLIINHRKFPSTSTHFSQHKIRTHSVRSHQYIKALSEGVLKILTNRNVLQHEYQHSIRNALRQTTHLMCVTCRYEFSLIKRRLQIVRKCVVHKFGTQNILWTGTAQSVLATCYELGGLGIESQQRRYFPQPSRPFLGLDQPTVKCIPSLPRG